MSFPSAFQSGICFPYPSLTMRILNSVMDVSSVTSSIFVRDDGVIRLEKRRKITRRVSCTLQKKTVQLVPFYHPFLVVQLASTDKRHYWLRLVPQLRRCVLNTSLRRAQTSGPCDLKLSFLIDAKLCVLMIRGKFE